MLDAGKSFNEIFEGRLHLVLEGVQHHAETKSHTLRQKLNMILKAEEV